MDADKIEVGKTYVFGTLFEGQGFVPIHCNYQYSPDYPFRVTICSRVRHHVYAHISGFSEPQKINPHSLYEIDVARDLYRKTLKEVGYNAERAELLVCRV